MCSRALKLQQRRLKQNNSGNDVTAFKKKYNESGYLVFCILIKCILILIGIYLCYRWVFRRGTCVTIKHA